MPSRLASTATAACPVRLRSWCAPKTACTIRWAVAFDTPAEAANAAMPATLLPPARFAATSPACSRLTLVPADAARAVSWDRAAAELLALAADARGGAGLPDAADL